MHITLTAEGSRGDVQPFVALAKGLQAAGHTPRIVAPLNYEKLIREHGIDYHRLPVDMYAAMRGRLGQDFIDEGSNPFLVLKNVRDAVAPSMEQYFDVLQTVSETTDLFVTYNISTFLTLILNDLRPTPFVIASFFPIAETREHPSALWFSQRSYGGWYNRWTGAAVLRMMWSLYNKPVNRLRQQHGLAKTTLKKVRQQIRSVPYVLPVSAAVYPKPRDWLAHHAVPGYWFLDEPEWSPPDDLVEFLEDGEPPIYFGFGSMVSHDPTEISRMILTALAETRQRGLLMTGWGGISAVGVYRKSVFALGSAPHNWLLPRMKAVVHHGGAGTTGAGLRAGKPTVIIPFAADQPFWGERVAALGAGSKPIPRKQLTAQNLADAITDVIQPRIVERAAAIGEQVRTEDGIATTIEMLESWYNNGDLRVTKK